MTDRTYITLSKSDRATVQLNIWKKTTGTPFSPSGAYYSVKGTVKDTTVIPRTLASNHINQVWATITQTVTSSAGEYDIYWEIHKSGGDIVNHCTKLLVVEDI